MGKKWKMAQQNTKLMRVSGLLRDFRMSFMQARKRCFIWADELGKKVPN